ncbi:MAG: ThiF family adenylyltransferase [Labedaea sp.]
MPDELPKRPRVRPGLQVLRRRPGEIQIGLDPRHAAVVSSLPDSVVHAIGRLTGHRTTADLLEALGPDPADQDALCELLGALAARDLVRDATPSRPVPGRLAGEETAAAGRRDAHPAQRRELAVAVHGQGRLAVALACLLATAGVGWVHVAATGTVHPEDVGTGYLGADVGRRRREAARDAVRRVDRTVRTGPFQDRNRPGLVLLTDAVVADPEVVEQLVANRVPHLSAHIRDGVGIVGPLVIPGLTSCLRCADLRRAQLDPCWPGIATQLAGRPQLADLACTQATAGFAAAQALDALGWSPSAHARPATWNTSVEIDPFSATTHHRCWQPHPACPCRAARAEQVDRAGHPKLLRIRDDQETIGW